MFMVKYGKDPLFEKRCEKYNLKGIIRHNLFNEGKNDREIFPLRQWHYLVLDMLKHPPIRRVAIQKYY